MKEVHKVQPNCRFHSHCSPQFAKKAREHRGETHMLAGVGRPMMVYLSGRTWRKTPSGWEMVPVMQMVAGGAPLSLPGRFEPGRTRAKHGQVKVLAGAQ